MKIKGVEYTVKELSMEEGFHLFGSSGELDIPALIRASVMIDGVPAKEGEISLGVAQKLIPEVLRANGLEAEEGGND